MEAIEMEVNETLAYVLIFVFGIVFFVLINNTIINLDTSAWAFTGHDFVISFLPVIPWMFLVGCLMVPVYMVIKKT